MNTLMKSVKLGKSIPSSQLKSVLKSKLDKNSDPNSAFKSIINMVSLMNQRQAIRASYLIFDYVAQNEKLQNQVDPELMTKLLSRFISTSYIANILSFYNNENNAIETRKKLNKEVYIRRKYFDSLVTNDQLVKLFSDVIKKIEKVTPKDPSTDVRVFSADFHYKTIQYVLITYYLRNHNVKMLCDIIYKSKIKCYRRMHISNRTTNRFKDIDITKKLGNSDEIKNADYSIFELSYLARISGYNFNLFNTHNVFFPINKSLVKTERDFDNIINAVETELDSNSPMLKKYLIIKNKIADRITNENGFNIKDQFITKVFKVGLVRAISDDKELRDTYNYIRNSSYFKTHKISLVEDLMSIVLKKLNDNGQR